MFNWLRKKIYKNWYHKNDPFIVFAGSYISIDRKFAWLSHIETDRKFYLLMPRGWINCQKIWDDINNELDIAGIEDDSPRIIKVIL